MYSLLNYNIIMQLCALHRCKSCINIVHVCFVLDVQFHEFQFELFVLNLNGQYIVAMAADDKI